MQTVDDTHELGNKYCQAPVVDARVHSHGSIGQLKEFDGRWGAGAILFKPFRFIGSPDKAGIAPGSIIDVAELRA